VRVYVREPDLGRVRPGMEAQVFSDTYPNQPITGTVGYISSVAEFTPKSVQTEELRTSLVYEVRVVVEDEAGALRLGQPVTVRLPAAAKP
jgi:HlyD family secretion protein